MRLEYQIVIALLLDLAFGDPRWFPHPVRLIGRLITALEGPARRAIPDARVAGAVMALTALAGFFHYARVGRNEVSEEDERRAEEEVRHE